MIEARSPLADLRSLIWPVECGGCGAVDVPLCPVCGAALRVPAQPWAPVVSSITTCPSTWSPLAYSGPVREAIVAWKDHGRLDLTRRLTPVLTAAAAQALSLAEGHHRSVLLVPVPSSPRVVRRRGQDVVAVLAAQVARELRRTGHDVVRRRALRPVRRVRDQVGLSAAERSANLAGALVAASPTALAGRSCLLLDDVITTGASLAEARRALEAAGARVVAAATVAATARRP